jgi:hypothetical protein
MAPEDDDRTDDHDNDDVDDEEQRTRAWNVGVEGMLGRRRSRRRRIELKRAN